jgi:4-aminobutyrate aminotransferase
MGGTYGGNSVCCSAALAVLDVFEKEDILGNVMTSEQVVRQRLQEIDVATGMRMIREVRGRGLMIGESCRDDAARDWWLEISGCTCVVADLVYRVSTTGVEFNQPDGKNAGWVAKEVSMACLSRGLLVLACGPYDTVRLIPALNISRAELNKGLDIFADAVDSVMNEAYPNDVGA